MLKYRLDISGEHGGLFYFSVKYNGHFLHTRGPKGPWVAHQRKRSKVTMETIIENPRGII